MSEAKFTPGAWVAKTGPITNDQQCVVMGPSPHEEGELWRVCVVDAATGKFTRSNRFVPDADCPIRDANARLIAACPTMWNYIAQKAKEGDTDAAAIVATIIG